MIATIIILLLHCIKLGVNIADNIYNNEGNKIISAIIAFLIIILLYQYAGLFDKFM